MNTNKTRERETYQIVPLTFEDHAIRMALIDGEPWFIAKDICDVLGLGNPPKALLGFPDDERSRYTIPTPGGEQKMLAVNESGLYRLVFRTRKPDAWRFKTWVFAKVLPTIWQNGTYQTNEQQNDQLMPFSFENHAVRTVLIDDAPWFIVKDVCDALGLGNVTETTKNFPDSERGSVALNTPGGKQEMLIINEPGLYQLIFQSRKPEAERFKTWVFAEVLPALRQNGSYQTPELREQLELLGRLGGVDRVIADAALARIFQIFSGNKAMDISRMFKTVEVALARSEVTGRYLASGKAAMLAATSERPGLGAATMERYIQEIRRFVAETGLIPVLSKSRNGYYATESAGRAGLPVKPPPRRRPTVKDIETALAGRQEALFDSEAAE